MRNLALSDDILLKIDKPARYIGGEVNMIKKDPKQVDIRYAMCFPDVCSQQFKKAYLVIFYDINTIYCG